MDRKSNGSQFFAIKDIDYRKSYKRHMTQSKIAACYQSVTTKPFFSFSPHPQSHAKDKAETHPSPTEENVDLSYNHPGASLLTASKKKTKKTMKIRSRKPKTEKIQGIPLTKTR